MATFNFDLQRFAEVMVGKSGGDSLTVSENKTQVYGLAGNDTLKSNAKSDVLLIGGSGNDVLQMTGGTGTLVGGKGKDTFALNYSATKKISAVIEDIDPTNDKIVITYDGDNAPLLSYSIDGDDVIWTDDNGYFNMTLKGSNEASDYFDGTAHEYVWDVLRIVNQERENQNLSPLTLSQGLMDASSIRSVELVQNFSHTRPNGTSCFTAVKKDYWGMGENIAAGQVSPENVMNVWMNSSGHRANILTGEFKKIGVGYCYDTSDDFEYHWVQMFGGNLSSPDTISTSKILRTSITANKGNIPTDDTPTFNTVIEVGNTNIRRGGTYTIAKNFSGTIRINTTDAVIIDGSSAGNLKNVQILNYSKTADLTINNLNVTNDSGNVIVFYSGAGNKIVINGKNGAAIRNVGDNASISGGAGNDSIYANGKGKNITISGGAGNDDISNDGDSVTISGGSDNDDIRNNGLNVTINGGAGNDSIKNYGDSVTVSGGSGNDSIFSSGNNVTIDGGASNDSIENASENVSINGGTGNDSIKNWGGDSVTIDGGAGNDSIENYGDSVMINGGDGDDSIENRGDSVMINGGDGDDSIENWGGDSVTIDGGAGNDSIENYGDSVTVSGGSGNDSIYSSGNNVTINGGAGNDSIENYGDSVTVSGGSGNDSIYSSGNNVTIDGGEGNDSIKNHGNNVTIDGGAGNDTIINNCRDDLTPWGDSDGSNVLFKYAAGDGNDKIYGFNATSTLSIGGGNYSSTKSGSDVIVTVGDGKITLAGAANLSKLNIKGTLSGGSSNSTLMTVTNSTKSPVTIAPDVKTVDASKRTKAIKITGNELANSIKAGSKNDTLQGKDGNDTIYGNGGHDKIYGQADDDKLYGGDGNDSLYGGIGNDTLSGGKGNDYFKGGDGNDVFIFSAGNDVIADFTAGQDKIKLSNASIKSSSISGSDVVFTLDSGKLTVTGGKDQYITIIDASGKETSEKYGPTPGDDKTLTVTKDATLGSDYQNADASKLTKSVKITGNALNNSIKGGSGNDSISGLAGDDKITAGNGKDTLTGGDGKDLLYGQAGDDKIYGQGNDDTLYGGAGNDSLWGGVGNDWLKGGLGNDYIKGGGGDDTFVYIDGDGKDIISGFDNGDLLQITGTFSTSYNSSKKEIYFKVGSTAKAITLTDFGDTTTFHVNNDTYQLNGSKLVKK